MFSMRKVENIAGFIAEVKRVHSEEQTGYFFIEKEEDTNFGSDKKNK